MYLAFSSCALMCVLAFAWWIQRKGKVDVAYIAKTTSLDLTDDEAPFVIGRFLRPAKFVAVGASIGSMVGAVVGVLLAHHNLDMVGVSAVLSGAGLGVFAGASVWLVVDSSRRARDAGSIVRGRGISLLDYMPAAFVIFPLIAIVGIAVLLAVTVWLMMTSNVDRTALFPDVFRNSALIPLVAALLSLTMLALTAAVTVRRKQAAPSEEFMRWDDSVVISVLLSSANYSSVVLLSVGLSCFNYAADALWSSNVAHLAPQALPFILIVAGVPFALSLLFVGFHHNPERHFLRRMWPESVEAADRRDEQEKEAARAALRNM